MALKERKSGLEILGDNPWGTHFCLFYQLREDLIDILVPYFKAGLENNEYCMWVTSEPLNEKDAESTMRKAMPNFEHYLEKKQIEIIPHTEWYLVDNEFESQRVLNGWIDKLNYALNNGYDGLRLTGNTFWLENEDWKSFMGYEEEVNNVIGNYQMIGICTYSLEKCGPFEIIDVIRNHQYAVIRREGKWNYFKSMEQIKAEQKLKESEENYKRLSNELEAIIDCIPIIIFYKSKDDVVLRANKFFADALNLRKEQMYGKTTFELFPEHQANNFRKDDLEVINSGNPKYNIEEQWDMAEGTRWALTSKIPYYNDNGELIGVIGCVVDITERKKAEENIIESERMYREAFDRAEFYKDLFTHDINNILQSILTGIQLNESYINNSESSEVQKVNMGTIKEEVIRGAKLVSNVRKLSKLEEIESSLKTIEVLNFLKKIIEFVENMYKGRDVAIQIDSISKELFVKANDLLEDAFENILINAIRHNKNPMVEIVIKISKEQQEGMKYIKIEFLDNGNGVEDHRKKLIFKKRDSKEKSVLGTGLGLSLVRKIIEFYEGKIWVEDRVKGDYSKGSNFVILIPMVK